MPAGEMSVEERLRLADIDPELRELLASRPPSPPYPFDIPKLRHLAAERKRSLIAAGPAKPDTIAIRDVQIPMRDGADIVVRVYNPLHRDDGHGPFGCFVMYHGGGFCFGDLDSEQINCSNFCEQLGLVVVNVDYRLAPEHPYPIGLQDAHDALKWVVGNASSIGADLTKAFILGGNSAGANFAITISHMARDEAMMPPLTGIWLSVPLLVSNTVVPERYRPLYLSYEQNRDAVTFNRQEAQFYLDAYRADESSPLASPLIWPTGHAGLPPTYFQICGMDALRDDGLIYEQILREEHGIATKVDLYPGLPHGFWSKYPSLSASAKRVSDSVEGARWLLEQGGQQGKST